MRMKTTLVGAALLLPLVVATVVVGGPAAAQDIKGDKELTERGRRIDKAANTADAGRVTDRIVDEFKGSTFKFSPTDSQPRALTADDVKALRQQGLGFGEISILLALAAKQPSGSPKSVDEILAMRKPGESWGKVAKVLGYKNLGSVLKSVKGAETDVDRVAKADDKHVDKAGKTENVEKMAQPERIERLERPERPERPGR